MESILRSVVLGIIQGLTEFLPVSSSGHLEITKYFLGDTSLAEQSMLMTVSLHAATALSTIVVFRKDILRIFSGLFQKGWNDEKLFSIKIILSMIPAALVGVMLESEIAQLFNRMILLVCAMLVITGFLLLFADRAKSTGRKVNFSDAMIIGLAQAVAIIPGISRSGATISTSVLLGIDREKAARFSFLMVVPLILGKMSMDILNGSFTANSIQAIPLLAGFLAAFTTGVLACVWMIRLVKNSKLRYFSVYCWVAAIITAAAYFLSNVYV